jgi:glycosyltransferase involved in cell wall biosynthesis
MKVLFTHERYLPDAGGGGEIIVHRRVQTALARGIDVQVVVAGDPKVDHYEGIAIRRVPTSRHALPLAVPALISAGRGADLIHTFTYHAALPGLIAGRCLNKPVFCEFLGLFGRGWSVMRPPSIAWAYRSFERMLLALPFDGRIFLSHDPWVEALREKGSRVIVAPPGVDSHFFEPVAAECKDDIVLFAGKFEKRKGIQDLFAVARACPEVRFAALGWGPDADALMRAAPANIAMTVVTVGSSNPYRTMLGRARIFFFPSYAETFGMVVAEAMARGCAIISTTSQDFRGIRVNPGQIGEMIEAVRRLWRDRSKSLDWGEQNRAKARHYDWETSCDIIVDLYQSVLAL